jgi:non-specific serine/threonine protein kinase/serine/threonine-protein kinase
MAAAAELGSPAGVLAELRTLLESTRRSSVLDEPLARIFDDISPAIAARDVLRGRQFGGWLLEGEIGRGGMSVVYRATRTGDGFEQHAAFKLLSVGFLHEAHIQGFLRERKILSELTHPGIARLIDGGVTPDGTPYLVMEYIEGQRIDAFCQQQAADGRPS